MAYYGKKMSSREMKEQAEQAAIWRLSRRKAAFTTARTKLIETGLQDNPDVAKGIKLLELERKKLDLLIGFE